jgi:hypothetical protein
VVERTSFSSAVANVEEQSAEDCQSVCRAGESRHFDGGCLECFGSSGGSKAESGWQVVVVPRNDAFAPGGHMMSDISASIEVMLRHALDDKWHKLKGISGFDRIGLVLINTYLFADDIREINSALHLIISKEHKYSLFDMIFYITSDRLHVVYDKRADSSPARRLV